MNALSLWIAMRGLLKPALPVLRPIRNWAVRQRAQAAVNRMTVEAGEPAVCYVTRRFPHRPPMRAERAYGGEIKMTYLAEAFPHAYPCCNILYVVSSASSPLTGPAIVAAARRRGVKVVLNQNGVAYPGWHGPGWEAVNRPMAEVMRMADLVLYQSQFCKLSADRFLGQPQASWKIVYNSVDTLHFAPATVNPDAHHLVLLLGGTQSSFHRLQIALQTVAVLAGLQHRVRLLVTGRLAWLLDEQEAATQASRLANELQIADCVEFVGPYAQAEAPSVLRQAHILLHTQYNDSCPTLVLEAMACGLPVVYSASGGTPELVGDESGIGIPTELRWDCQPLPAPHQLAEAVLKVAERRAQYAEAARRRAVEQFSLEHYTARHRELFAQLLET